MGGRLGLRRCGTAAPAALGGAAVLAIFIVVDDRRRVGRIVHPRFRGFGEQSLEVGPQFGIDTELPFRHPVGTLLTEVEERIASFAWLGLPVLVLVVVAVGVEDRVQVRHQRREIVGSSGRGVAHQLLFCEITGLRVDTGRQVLEEFADHLHMLGIEQPGPQCFGGVRQQRREDFTRQRGAIPQLRSQSHSRACCAWGDPQHPRHRRRHRPRIHIEAVLGDQFVEPGVRVRRHRSGECFHALDHRTPIGIRPRHRPLRGQIGDRGLHTIHQHRQLGIGHDRGRRHRLDAVHP